MPWRHGTGGGDLTEGRGRWPGRTTERLRPRRPGEKQEKERQRKRWSIADRARNGPGDGPGVMVGKGRHRCGGTKCGIQST